MPIKDILVILDASEASENRIDAATAIAAKFGARILGLYTRPSDLLAGMLTTEPFVDGSLMTQVESFDRRRHDALQAHLEQTAQRDGLQAEWRSFEGDPLQVATRHSRYADLVIAGQSDPKASGGSSRVISPADILKNSGRPVLVLPCAGRFGALPQNILIAWNASREGSLAVHEALPLLQTAKQVTLTIILPKDFVEDPNNKVGVAIAGHLARHDVHITVDKVPVGAKTPAETLLARAKEIQADMLVAGSYGRNQFTEMLIGGTTKTLLKSATLPLFMSH